MSRIWQPLVTVWRLHPTSIAKTLSRQRQNRREVVTQSHGSGMAPDSRATEERERDSPGMVVFARLETDHASTAARGRHVCCCAVVGRFTRRPTHSLVDRQLRGNR